MYRLEIRKSAVKELEKVSKVYYKSIRAAICELEDDPRPNGCKKLHGTDDLYRIRVGMYRIVYTIQDTVLYIEIIKIGHRKDIYE